MRIFIELLTSFVALLGPVAIYLNHIYILKKIKEDKSIYINMWVQCALLIVFIHCFMLNLY
ncbi:MAG: hypothetical protein FH753_14715 [Firmicutes bacterium]|nr:hypothetical protein [Bacillota bacterium]